MDYDKLSLEMHEKLKGKISTKLDFEIKNKDDLSIAYTPGIAAVSKEIIKNKESLKKYTAAGKTIAVISNGTAVLGLGDVGAEAAYPVMEGKAALFKNFGDVDCVPICVNIKDIDKFVEFVEHISLNFAGINLEDIKAPDCFVIEKKLIEKLNIPVFHDDQHGTAIVVAAALKNSLELANKKLEEVKIVISGAGSAGIAIAKLLKKLGSKNIWLLDSQGLITNSRVLKETEFEKEQFKINEEPMDLKESIKGADVFIGVSKPEILTSKDVELMAKKPIIFALSNPVPEMHPLEAKKADVFVMATGRSDFENQINNVLAFPGLFRGTLNANATKITDEMKMAAVNAIVTYHTPTTNSILPSPLDKKVHEFIAEEVRKAWK